MILTNFDQPPWEFYLRRDFTSIEQHTVYPIIFEATSKRVFAVDFCSQPWTLRRIMPFVLVKRYITSLPVMIGFQQLWKVTWCWIKNDTTTWMFRRQLNLIGSSARNNIKACNMVMDRLQAKSFVLEKLWFGESLFFEVFLKFCLFFSPVAKLDGVVKCCSELAQYWMPEWSYCYYMSTTCSNVNHEVGSPFVITCHNYPWFVTPKIKLSYVNPIHDPKSFEAIYPR